MPKPPNASTPNSGETGHPEPYSAQGSHILQEDTPLLAYQRRQLEKAHLRAYGPVKSRDKPESPAHGVDPDHALQASGVKAHPYLQTQIYDGAADPDVSPAPTGSPEALAEFERERAEQTLQKQLRLGQALNYGRRFDPTPTR